MPHLPEPTQMASLGMRHELNAGATAPKSKPASQVKTTAEVGAKARELLGLSTISIRKFTVDPDRVFKQLFNKEPEVDEHTGISSLVPNTARRRS